jgi:hypothetical protein
MVLPRVHNHRAFQRAAILLIGTGAVTAWVCAGAEADLRRLLFVVVAVVVAAAAHQQGRSLWFAGAVALAGSGLAAVSWPGLWVVAAALVGASPWAVDAAGTPVAGGLFGLVAGVGLFVAHLEPRVKRMSASTNADDLDLTARALLARAARAHKRIWAELADDQSAAARALVADANRIAKGVLDLASRASQLRMILAALHRERRSDDVDVGTVIRRDGDDDVVRGCTAGSDSESGPADRSRLPATSAASAIPAPTSLVSPVLAELEAAADRLQAGVRAHVVALEQTALELLGRRAGRIAEAAAALTPVARQLVDGGEHLRAQTTALAELNAPATDSPPKA